MNDDFGLRLRALIDNMPERVKWQIGTAICIVGGLCLLQALTKTTPKTQSVSQPAAPAVAIVAKVETAPKAIAEPKPVAKPAAVVEAAPVKVEKVPAKTADPVLQRVYAEAPELDPSSPAFQKLDDWAKVTRLRDFAYRHTAFAAGPNQAAYRAGAAMVERVAEGEATLAEAYEFFDRAKGGVGDREAAELLRRLYAAAGFTGFELEIGVPPTGAHVGNATHTLNLVRIRVQGFDGQTKSILSVQDPSLNIGLVDSQGQPIDYYEMLKLLAARQAGQIQFVEKIPGKSSQRDPVTVAFSGDLEKSLPTDFAASWNLAVSPVWCTSPSGTWIVKGPRALWSYERVGDVSWKPELFRAGLPPESIYLHCFPQDLRGGSEATSLLERAKDLLSSQASTATVRSNTITY